MGHLSNTRELKEDVLFRASEPLSGSKFDPKALTYLNRVYRTLASGASEFLPEFVEDWWWLRGTTSLNLQPVNVTGTVEVTQGSTAINFSLAPGISMAGRRLLISGAPDIPIISTHTALTAPATLDQQWTGDTNLAAEFKAMKTTYDLDIAVQVIMSPMIIFHEPGQAMGLTPERMDELYPLARLAPGGPQAFSLESETRVRFSHGGSDEGREIRAEYRYRPKVVDLTDQVTSIPLVPAQWMHLLADMALTYLLIDKNDDRSNAVALAARTGLAAMFKDNRRRLAKVDTTAGKIMPRQGQLRRNVGRSWPNQ